LALQFGRQPLIIVVEKGGPFAATQAQTRVSCTRTAHGFIDTHDSDSGIAPFERREVRFRAVRGRVIHDNQLEIRRRLLEDGLDRTFEEIDPIVRRQHHAYQRRVRDRSLHQCH
jgi:hypothetical protein